MVLLCFGLVHPNLLCPSTATSLFGNSPPPAVMGQAGHCSSVEPRVWLTCWGPSLLYSPLVSCFPLFSPFLVNRRTPVCLKGRSCGKECLQCLYKLLLGQIKGLSLSVSDNSQRQLCREGCRSKASSDHSPEISTSLSIP